MAVVALVGPEIEENLSLRYLAASLAEAGHCCRIVPLNRVEDFGGALAAVLHGPDPVDVVGISLAFQWRAPDFLAFAYALRHHGYRGHVTVGGHFATFADREILTDFPEIDSVCRQEAETTIVLLAEAVTGGDRALDSIDGLSFRGDDGAIVRTCMPAVPDLHTLPRPVRVGEPARCFGHAIAPLVASRGCYANCSFCCIAAWHEQTLPGKRYRLRTPEAVADEMVELQRTRGVDVFVFHDDNFFVPHRGRSLERLTALADALDARGIGKFATVVKARPNDVDPEIFRVLIDRLGCVRCYVGIETDADQGLGTLQRWANSRVNHRAIEIARELDLFVCFNMLLFDPDTTIDSLRTNVGFMEYAPEFPFNFGRVELYAGTPLLTRMQAEGRTRGDWLQWDYDLQNPAVDRVWRLAMECFGPRNFGGRALANDIQAVRFDLVVANAFHPEAVDPAWMIQGQELSRRLGLDSAAGLRRIIDHVDSALHPASDAMLARDLSPQLRATEESIRSEMLDIATALTASVGRGEALTFSGDVVATPLQRGVAAPA